MFAQGAVLIDPAISAAGDVDTATVSARMSNGALALIDNSRKAVYGYDQRAEVFGSKGCVQNANDLPSTKCFPRWTTSPPKNRSGSFWNGTWRPIE